MKKLLFILSFLVTLNSYSQNDGLEICFQYQKSLRGFSTDKEAEDALNKILNVIGASRNFLLVPCDEISNALAITYKGERYILYDKSFLNKLEVLSNDWSSLFVLAHEVGHHINGHTRDFLISDKIDSQTFEERREEELEADEFAGFVLANLGASINDINELFDIIGAKGDDTYSTHPNKDKRIAASKRGYVKYQPKVIVPNSTKLNTKKKILKSSNWTLTIDNKRQREINEAVNRLGRQLNFFEKKDIDERYINNKQPYELRMPVSTKTAVGKGYAYINDTVQSISLFIQKKIYIDESTLTSIWFEDFDEMPNFHTFPKKHYYFPQLKENGYIWFEDKYPTLENQLLKNTLGENILVEVEYSIDDMLTGVAYSELKGWMVTPVGLDPDNPYYDAENERKLSYALKSKSKPKRFLKYQLDEGDKWSNTLLVPADVYLYFRENHYSKQNLFIDNLRRGNKLYIRIGKSTTLDDEYSTDKKNILKKAYIYEFDLTGSSKALNFN